MSKMIAREACLNCRFFSLAAPTPGMGSGTQTHGLCRRYPAEMVPTPNGNQHPITYWVEQHRPLMAIEEWCGEWKGREV